MRISTVGASLSCILLFVVDSLAGPIKTDNGKTLYFIVYLKQHDIEISQRK